MLITKEVEIKVNGNMVKYYNEKGYNCKSNSIIKVKVEDLKAMSGAIVEVGCDYCGKEIPNVAYSTYNIVVNRTGNYVCQECAPLKRENTIMKRYGVKNAYYIEGVNDKKKQTNLDKYGVEYTFQSEEVKEKIRKANIEKYSTPNPANNPEIRNKIEKSNIVKYGCKNPMSSEEVQQKLKQSMLNKYGVENPMKIERIKEKASNTCLCRYGVNNPSQSPQIRQKVSNTFYQKGTQRVSTQQLYLYNLFGGELNYPFSSYNIDICLVNEKIAIEYDGGGHNLQVKFGGLSQDEYNIKTIIRDKIIKKAGYKQIRIISEKDYLPLDEILLQILEQAKEYFETTDHTWVEYNIDSSIMRNAENKEGIYYDYGDLRKIKKTS